MTIPSISELDLPDDELLRRIVTAVAAHPEVREPLLRVLLTDEFLNLPTEVKELREEMREGFRAVNERIDETNRSLTERIDETNHSLTERIDETNRSLTERIDETNRSLTERIDETNRSLTERIDETNRSLNERIDETSRSLNERIDETNRSLTERIDETNRSLSERIDETNRSLSERIDETNRSLSERIDETNRSLSERIDETNRSLSERIDETNHSLSERIDETNQTMGEQFQAVNERIDENTRSIRTLTGQVGELRGEAYERRCAEQIDAALIDHFDFAALADRTSINRQLVLARRSGLLTREEYEGGRNVDIVAQEQMEGETPSRLAAIEVSVTFNEDDLKNAAERAATIARVTGIPTRAFLITRNTWPEAVATMADQSGVTIVRRL